MNRYEYIGKHEVSLEGVGIIAPGQIVETQLTINNPDFKKLEDKRKGK